MKKVWIAMAATTAFACSGDGSIDSEDNGLIEVLEIEVHGDSWTQLSRRTVAKPVALRVGEDVVGTTHALWTNCSSGALRVYDQANYAGNVLCLSGTGSVELATVPRAGSNWKNRIRSYQANNEFGQFKSDIRDGGVPDPGQSAVNFCAGSSSGNPAASIRDADTITLTAASPSCAAIP